MSTRAKFKCIEVTKKTGWSYETPFLYGARFSPVTNGSEENKSFFAATPTGSIELTTIKEDVFEVGKEYYIDFTLAVVN